MFHPAVRAWFDRTFGQPTPAQAQGWAEILAGHDTLIAAPRHDSGYVEGRRWC